MSHTRRRSNQAATLVKKDRKFYLQPFKGRGLQPWHWRIKARNGQISATSEGYASTRNRDNSMNSVAADTGWEIKEEK